MLWDLILSVVLGTPGRGHKRSRCPGLCERTEISGTLLILVMERSGAWEDA